MRGKSAFLIERFKMTDDRDNLPASNYFDELDTDSWGEPTPCPICAGEGIALGQLGKLLWFRCRACGMDFNRKIS